MGGIVTSPDVFEFYRYVPSKEAAAVFVILFALSSTLHLYQLIRTRAWIVVPLVVGGICKIDFPGERPS